MDFGGDRAAWPLGLNQGRSFVKIFFLVGLISLFMSGDAFGYSKDSCDQCYDQYRLCVDSAGSTTEKLICSPLACYSENECQLFVKTSPSPAKAVSDAHYRYYFGTCHVYYNSGLVEGVEDSLCKTGKPEYSWDSAAAKCSASYESGFHEWVDTALCRE